MKLYIITNGFQGFGIVKTITIAENEERALELATLKFKAESETNPAYGERYYTNLKAELICKDVSKEWSSEVEED